MEHASSQDVRDASVAVQALLAAKVKTPLAVQPTVQEDGAVVMTDVGVEAEAEVAPPAYGALIAQRLHTMTDVTHQFAAFLRTADQAHATASPRASSSSLASHKSAKPVKPAKDVGRIKKRIELLKGMLFLRTFADETSIDYSMMDVAIIHAKTVFR